MSLKHGILGLLNYGSMSGYQLSKAFGESLNFFWPAQVSQVYRELESMQGCGWVATAEELQRGRRVTTLFAITDSGRAELLRWLGEPLKSEERSRNPFLLRLFFQSMTGLDSIRDLVLACKARAEAGMATQREILSKVIPDRHGKVEDNLAALCWSEAAEFGLLQFEAQARWAETCLARLGALEGAYDEEGSGSQRKPQRQGLRESENGPRLP